ncbi:MAG: hypothetical protein RLZZ200_1102 [Pseudomonadota bacterium]|jgi:uncharacterized protein (TIGR02246 family)
MNRFLASAMVVLAGGLSALPVARADDVADVEAATQRWIAAFNSKDTAGISALYAPDAVFQGTSSPVIRDTPALVNEYFKGLSSLGDQRMATADHRVQIFGDIAINSGYYTRRGTQDGKPVEGRARFSFVYARRDGRWLIVNHHSSTLP